MKKSIMILSALFMVSTCINPAVIAGGSEDDESGTVNLRKKFINDSNVKQELDKVSGNVQALDLGENQLSPVGLQVAINHKTLHGLTSLDLSHTDLSTRGAFVLSFAEPLKTLTVLRLSRNHLKDEGVQYLTDSRYLTGLTTLNLSDNDLHDRALGLLASGSLKKLEEVDLSDNSFSSIGAVAIAAFPFKPKRLHLDSTGIGDLGVQTLSTSSIVQELQILTLRNNDLTSDSGISLGKSRHLLKLEKLSLHGNRIGVDGIGALVASGTYRSTLTDLGLSENLICDSDVSALVGNNALQRLQRLNLANYSVTCCMMAPFGKSRITDEGMKTLSTASSFSALTDLDLCGHHITSKGVIHLLGSNFSSNLQKLSLRYNVYIGNEGLEAISTTPNLARLEKLWIDWNRIDKDGVKTFAFALKNPALLPQLRYANLTDNRFGNEGKKLLEEAKKHRDITLEY